MINFFDSHFKGCTGLVNACVSERTKETIKKDLRLALLVSLQVFMTVAHKLSEASAKGIRRRVDHELQSRAMAGHQPGSTRMSMEPCRERWIRTGQLPPVTAVRMPSWSSAYASGRYSSSVGSPRELWRL